MCVTPGMSALQVFVEERVGEEDVSFDCSRANLAYYSYKKAPNALCHHEGKKYPFVPCFKWICNPGSAFLLSHY